MDVDRTKRAYAIFVKNEPVKISLNQNDLDTRGYIWVEPEEVQIREITISYY